MSIWEEMEADGPDLLKNLGKVVIFRGQQMLALIDRNPFDQMMGDGGMVVRASYRIRFFAKKKTPLYIEPPKYGEQVSLYGRDFTITSVTPRFPEPWFDVMVQSATQ